jgi:hypothetical protein
MAEARRIKWGPTLQVNFLRALMGGVVWMIVAYALQMPVQPGGPGHWFLIIAAPVGYLLVLLPLALAADGLRRIGVPFAGLLTIPAAMVAVAGDPLVLVLRHGAPGLVPVDDFKLSLAYAIFVYEQ